MCRASTRPAGRGSAKPWAASAMRRAWAPAKRRAASSQLHATDPMGQAVDSGADRPAWHHVPMFEHVDANASATRSGCGSTSSPAGSCFAEAAILVGMVLPGETALLVAGRVLQAKYGNLNLGIMIAIAVVCAIAGDSVGYEFGKKFGPPLRRSRLGPLGGRAPLVAGRRVHPPARRQGGAARPADRRCCARSMPSMAGMSGMRYRTFLLWNATGGLIWAPGACCSATRSPPRSTSSARRSPGRRSAILALAIAVYVALHLRKRSIETGRGRGVRRVRSLRVAGRGSVARDPVSDHYAALHENRKHAALLHRGRAGGRGQLCMSAHGDPRTRRPTAVPRPNRSGRRRRPDPASWPGWAIARSAGPTRGWASPWRAPESRLPSWACSSGAVTT